MRVGFLDPAVAEWRRERPWAAVTSCRGELGHPFISDREAFGELRGLHGDKAVWKLIERCPDVDNLEDYETALAHWLDGE